MCRYYAHHHSCSHTTLTFAAFCDPASLIQNPCSERKVWQDLDIDEPCDDCRAAAAAAAEERGSWSRRRW
ncbi:hypothetical protein VTJ04DRAFT_6351 [Mycothermus thermophilus]|uniref:uncharacterized protein n=1 Tax=Humicola insolens TaxID=85995 RepID=UPI0037431EEB